jgi:hypothetical protein
MSDVSGRSAPATTSVPRACCCVWGLSLGFAISGAVMLILQTLLSAQLRRDDMVAVNGTIDLMVGCGGLLVGQILWGLLSVICVLCRIQSAVNQARTANLYEDDVPNPYDSRVAVTRVAVSGERWLL